MVEPIHRNTNNTVNCLSLQTKELAKDFLKRMGEQCGEDRAIRKFTRSLQNGRTSVHYEKIDYVYLPSHYSQQKLLMMYNHTNPCNTIKARSTFVSLWHNDENLKKIIIRTPSKNECDDCTSFRISMVDASVRVNSELNMQQASDSEESIQQIHDRLSTHIHHYRDLRANYENDIKRCKEGPPDDLTVICFDYAQNVPLPHDPRQPSAVYFLSLLNVYQFGIVHERWGIQTHFIYTEGKSGKGSNEVSTMVIDYLDRNLIGTKHLHLWADNCGGQNKNCTVIQLMAYLVIFGTTTGHIFESIEYKFQIKGHTRNSVDRGFGQITNAYSRNEVWSPSEYKKLIDNINSNICVNFENETFFDWSSFLTQLFVKPVGIQKYQMFRFERSKPFIMMCRANSTHQWIEINLKNPKFNMDTIKFLEPLPTKGLNIEKQNDLYDKVRKYVPAAFKDEICPKPNTRMILEVKDIKNKRRKRAAEEKKSKHKSTSILIR